LLPAIANQHEGELGKGLENSFDVAPLVAVVILRIKHMITKIPQKERAYRYFLHLQELQQ
jgi:hypothetical protein